MREMKQILHHPAAAAAALWYVARTSSDQSRLNIVGGPGPARLTGPPFKAPKASNREGNGDRASPPSRFGVCMGSVVSSPSGVLDRVPAENSFGTLPAWKNTWWQHIVWSMSCLMTRLPVLPPLSAPPRFGMYYVKKTHYWFDIQSHHWNLHRFVYDAAEKNYTFVIRGSLELGALDPSPLGALDKRVLTVTRWRTVTNYRPSHFTCRPSYVHRVVSCCRCVFCHRSISDASSCHR